VVFPQITLGRPPVKTVGSFGRGSYFVFGIIDTIKFGAVARVYGICLATRNDFAFTANCGNGGRLAVFAHIHAKGAGLLHGERQVGRVNLVGIAFAQFANSKIDRTFRDAHLHDAFVEIQKRERGHAAHVNGGLTSL
jgi:hypothetical protein